MRVLARLYKTPSGDCGYVLRGELQDGRRVEVFANQRKRCAEDGDFLLVAIMPRGEDPR